MFRKFRLSQDNITVLDVHTTSPGRGASGPDNSNVKARIGEPKTDLYIRANQFYLRSRLSRLRKSSSTII